MTDDGEPTQEPSTDAGSTPALTRLRAELEAIDEVAVEDRVEVFERANAQIAQELADLDEV